MLNTELFSNKSVDYSQFRPAYSPAAIEWLRSNVSGDSVLDVGAGTGIFTNMLLRAFKTVSAVEPNDDMRKCFQENLPELLCQDTTAEATGLPDDSVDLITVAQAFHWLDAEEFKREALRILRPGGSVAIVWNNSLKNLGFIYMRKHCFNTLLIQ